MLFWVALSMKLLEFKRLVAAEHVECVNYHSVRLGVEVSFAHISLKLCFDCICNQILDLLNGYRAMKPIVLEVTTVFECTSSSKASLWRDTFSSPSFSKFFLLRIELINSPTF